MLPPIESKDFKNAGKKNAENHGKISFLFYIIDGKHDGADIGRNM